MNNLADFEGKGIFLDTDIFLFAYSNHRHSKACEDFLQRMEGKEFTGYIDLTVLDEFLYKSIVATVSKMKHVKVASTFKLIKKHSDLLSSLVHLYEPLEDILSLKNLSVLDCSQLGGLTEEVVKNNGLLPSDALHAACCKANGIEHIATSDKDFEAVSFLRVWKP